MLATCLVGHTDSSRQTPDHSIWPSWPVGSVRMCRLCRPWHTIAATSDRSWHVGRCAGMDPSILDQCRTQQVSFNGQLSSKQLLLFGVPRGSVPGPLLYLLYPAEIEQLILRHGLHIHQYADDSQIYISVPVSHALVAIHSFAVCVHASQWVDEDQQTAAEPDQDAGHVARLRPAVEVRWHQWHPGVVDLGVILDSRLTLSAHVAALCQVGYYQLQLRQLLYVYSSLV